MRRIVIETIPHDQQRYDTAGDWWFDAAGDLHMRVSDMGNWEYQALVAFHELAEVLVCKARGIPQEVVDKFDIEFEKKRTAGDVSEPGDDPAAPYRKEHFFATSVERLMAAELGVDWQSYEQAIGAL